MIETSYVSKNETKECERTPHVVCFIQLLELKGIALPTHNSTHSSRPFQDSNKPERCGWAGVSAAVCMCACVRAFRFVAL